MGDKVPLKVWLLGLGWATASGAAPAGLLVLDWVTRWDDPLDWTMVWHLALSSGALGAVAYWRKHKALLQLPPTMQTAKDLAKAAQAGTCE